MVGGRVPAAAPCASPLSPSALRSVPPTRPGPGALACDARDRRDHHRATRPTPKQLIKPRGAQAKRLLRLAEHPRCEPPPTRTPHMSVLLMIGCSAHSTTLTRATSRLAVQVINARSSSSRLCGPSHHNRRRTARAVHAHLANISRELLMIRTHSPS